MPANSSDHWARDALLYHLYPLGCLGAPQRNPLAGDAVHRLRDLLPWVDYLAELGVDALYLGPLFESTAHGYDTIDYFRVDRRLGDDADLAELSQALHAKHIRLVLDAVFHHTGRDFWAFRELLEQGPDARHANWYCIDRARRSPLGDPFHYEGWAGHYDLAKLNLDNPEVCDHLLHAAETWIERYDIDGLRLDAADKLSRGFQGRLATRCRARKADFWVMGEVVHGDYRQWANSQCIDATTNYQAYKGLWSAHNDHNYFEIAHTLERQFGPGGNYRDTCLVNFADNHDVDRVASKLKSAAHLYPLYMILLCVPGMPALYYGSEWGLQGRRSAQSDAALRPALTLDEMRRRAPQPDLFTALRRLIAARRQHPALRRGDYRQLAVASQQLAFERRYGDERIVVAVNSEARTASLTFPIADANGARLVDVLDPQHDFRVGAGRCSVSLPACWGRILALRR